VSTLRHALFLALQVLRSSPGRSAVLVLGLTVALFLPVVTWLAGEAVEQRLMSRARATPVLLGHKGNEFDLVMNALYFRGQVRDPIPMAARDEVAARRYGTAVPLYIAYSAGGAPLVGTSLSYFEQRELTLSSGRMPAILGEAVAGAAVAEAYALAPGDKLRSDLTNLYNLAGSYPLVLRISGVLEPKGTPDDEALFTDVKTAWVLDGSIHGHAEVTRDDALNPEAEDGENLEATAAVFIVSEIDESNLDSFHFHGEAGEAPLSSVLVFPRDARARDQLLGDYALEERYQAVIPERVVGTILGIVLRVRDGLELYFGLVAGSTAAFFGLVIVLSLRLRRAELRLMRRLGCSRSTVAANVLAEILLLVVSALALTALLSKGVMLWLEHLL
jgi:putative ABC transport system permease protein